MTIETRIVGGGAQGVICQLGRDDAVYAEPGRFLWKTVNVAVDARITRLPHVAAPAAPATAGGPAARARLLQRALATASEMGKRVMPGESVALQRFRANGDGLVAFAASVPGAVRVLEVDAEHGWFVDRDAFVVAEASVDIGLVTVRGPQPQRVTMERFTGVGMLAVAAAGDVVEVNPARYDGVLQVDAGAVVAFDDRLGYTVDRVAVPPPQGVSAVFGAAGIVMATVEGDGLVLLQTSTLAGAQELLARRATGDDRARGGFLGNGVE